jgi:DNA polymerase elongation subunit (family B)
MPDPKILVLDIETAPALSYHWGMFKQNISLGQNVDPGGVMGVGWMWHGKRPVYWASDHDPGHEQMIIRARDLLDEADLLVTYNGQSFDAPHLYAEIAKAGLTPPSPVQHVDLYRASKKFRFLSHKLQHVSTQLGLEGKMETGGFQLWIDCLNGDARAWRKMGAYCKRDVKLTSDLYRVMLPWLDNHPHVGLWTGEDRSCNKCGSTNVHQRGHARTKLTTYARFQCQDCGGWSQGKHAVNRVDIRGVTR